MRRAWLAAVIACIALLYVVTILAGLHIRNFVLFQEGAVGAPPRSWQSPSASSASLSLAGESIRYGALLFNETSLYAAQYTSANLSCTSCHAQGGIQPYASPMVGLPALFPMYNQRAGRVITLQDRIQECFVRSENGKPLPYRGREMQALVDYIGWLSEPQPNRMAFVGRGLISLPVLNPDPARGAEIYKVQCAGCHGQDGEGRLQFPPLWGMQSFNDGAGMNSLEKMAAFVQHNMPQNRMGILSAQEAYDVSAFIHSKPRPAFNQAYSNY